ncbi:MAG TPA: hypothetical protein VNA23_11660 [Anaerolineales bacterium]|nr:hypothetical protein [Anaerolineales bacterium]
MNLKHVSATQAVGQRTPILYDAASGANPAGQIMSLFDFPPGEIIQTFGDGHTTLNTTKSGNSTYAGWTSNAANTPGFPSLNRAAGFQLDFIMQVENGAHTSNNRAGFSIIILSEDARGIELAFWENEIWVQNDDATGGLFTHGESASFPTTTGAINYQLIVTNDTYTLTANGTPILNGPLRDYRKFEGFPDPYQSPNFIFLGDDTTSAQARIQLSYVSVTGTEPVHDSLAVKLTYTHSISDRRKRFRTLSIVALDS